MFGMLVMLALWVVRCKIQRDTATQQGADRIAQFKKQNITNTGFWVNINCIHIVN